MTERPILFSGPMVRAILAGQKTQTRRIVKPHECVEEMPENSELGVIAHAACPYGQPGDRLWVRETWLHFDQAPRDTAYLEEIESESDPDIRAILLGTFKGRWKPSIHMHRFRSRITLEVVSVRIERLQDISADDSRAEGHATRSSLPTEVNDDAASDWYMDLWESINGPGSWAANPWVWVVEFRRMDGGEA